MDLIDRERAISKLEDLIIARRSWLTDGSAEIRGIDAAICELAALPSAEKPNKWLFINENNEPKFWEYNIRKGKISPITDLEDTSITWTAGIPFAEKTGRWVEEKDRHLHWHCSNCGYAISLIKMDGHYCPNCGARMEEG